MPVLNGSSAISYFINKKKKRHHAAFILVVLCLLCNLKVTAQSTVEVPATINFAGIELHLDANYQGLVKQEADKLLANNKYFRLTVERADAYFHIVERIFNEEQLPEDFKYLCLQESKLVSDVVSTSNAVGYWQFKKETAMEVGLRVDDVVDERMNIVASSRGAAKYIRKNNAQLNNWLHALLAYYAGLGGARLIIDPQYMGATSMPLDENTHWYITKFLAHKLAYESSVNRNPNPPLRVYEYPECENKTFEDLVRETNISLENIKDYNKWARAGKIPADKDYTILLPVKLEEQGGYLAMMARPQTGAETAKPYQKTILFGLITLPEDKPTPTVQQAKAEVLASAVAQVKAQQAATKITNADALPVVVNVDAVEDIKPTVASKSSQSGNVAASNLTASTMPTEVYKSAAPLFFTWNGVKAIMARKNDNIAKLALQADIDKEDFLDYNDLRIFDLIIPGQVYYIKAKKKKAKVPYHTVKEGETIWEISQAYGVRIKNVLAMNRMARPEKLKAGRVLWLRHSRPENIAIEYQKVEQSTPFPLPKTPVITSSTTQVNTSATSIIINANVAASANNSNGIDTTKAKVLANIKAEIASIKADSVSMATIIADTAEAPLVADAKDTSRSKVMAIVPSSSQSISTNAAKLQTAPVYKTAIVKASKPVMQTGIKSNSDSITSNSQTASATITPKAESTIVKYQLADSVKLRASNSHNFSTINLEAGQTLYSVSKQLDVDLDSLRYWNGLDTKPMRLGMSLKYRHIVKPSNDEAITIFPEVNKAKSVDKVDTIAIMPTQQVATQVKAIIQPKSGITQAKALQKDTTSTTKVPGNFLTTAKHSQPVADVPGIVIAGNKPKSTAKTTIQSEYTVKAGDTLYKIARENGVLPAEIMLWNNKTNPAISLGEKLVLQKAK